MLSEIVAAVVTVIVLLVAAIAQLVTGRAPRQPATGGADQPAGRCGASTECGEGLEPRLGGCFTPAEAAAAEAVVAGNGRDPFPGIKIDLTAAGLPYRPRAYASMCRRPVLELGARYVALRYIDFLARGLASETAAETATVAVLIAGKFRGFPAAEFFPRLEFVVGAAGVATGAIVPANVRVVEADRLAAEAPDARWVIACEFLAASHEVLAGPAPLTAGRAAAAALVAATAPRRLLTTLFFGYPPPVEPTHWFAGELRRYPWGAPSSTTCAVESVAGAGDAPLAPTARYDMGAIERRMFRLNLAERVWGWYPAAVADVPAGAVPGQCACYDCAGEVEVWRSVLAAGDALPTGAAIAAAMNRLTDVLDTASASLAAAGGAMPASAATLAAPPHSLRGGRPLAAGRDDVIAGLRLEEARVGTICRAAGLEELAGHCVTDAERAAVTAEARARTPAPELTLGAGSPGLPYRRYIQGDAASRIQLHNGQRKLLAVEVDFLTRAAGAAGTGTVVYAGAAPGTHIPFLADLFPGLKFVLYDPRDFDPALRRCRSITTRVQFFTDDDAREWTGRGAMFVSDIRTGESLSDMSTGSANALVDRDMAMQRRWVELMQPAAFSLKFRLPYSTPGAPTPPAEYLAGEVRVQPWAPQTSTETRLVGGAGDWARTATYDPAEYERQLFYVNTILRQWRTFPHSVPTAAVPGLDLCYDCAAEVAIWRAYEATAGRPVGAAAAGAIAEHMRRASRTIHRSLLEGYHGILPDWPMFDKMPFVIYGQKKKPLFIASSMPSKSGARVGKDVRARRARHAASK